MTPRAMMLMLAMSVAVVPAVAQETPEGAPAQESAGGSPPMGAAGPGMGLFGEIDADGDGAVTTEELRAYRAARIAGLDADADGFLTADEIVAHELAEAEARIRERVARRMEMQDLDGDGRLGAAELSGSGRGMSDGEMAGRMFRRADADGDGRVTPAEIQQMMSAMHERRGERGERGMDHDRRGGERGGGMHGGRGGFGRGMMDDAEE